MGWTTGISDVDCGQGHISCEMQLSVSSYPSIRMEQLGSHWTNFHEIWYKDLCAFMIILAEFLLEWETFEAKFCRDKQNTRVEYDNFPPPTPLTPENRAVYEIMWKNTVQPDRPQMTIWRMRTACWIPEATNTHSQYIVLIPFALQQWLRERVSMSRHTYSACPQRPSIHQFCKYQRIFAGAERIDRLTRHNCPSSRHWGV